MLFQLITNFDNGAGLEHDFGLLSQILTKAGHQVRGVHIHRPQDTAAPADVNIFLEVLVPSVMPFGRRNWIIPNSEWWGKHWDAHLSRIDRVLCKTPDCYSIWKKKMEGRCTLTGWLANDLFRRHSKKTGSFLHTAGKSLTKNTAVVAEAWKRYRIPYPLTVSAFKPEIAAWCKGVPNLRLVDRFPADELITEINTHRFFLMPSKYEGYGHAIHEALGCRAAVITTDAEPMRSFSGIDPRLLIGSTVGDRQGDASLAAVTPRAVMEKVNFAAALPESELEIIGDRARDGFIRDNNFFHCAIQGVLSGL